MLQNVCGKPEVGAYGVCFDQGVGECFAVGYELAGEALAFLCCALDAILLSAARIGNCAPCEAAGTAKSSEKIRGR